MRRHIVILIGILLLSTAGLSAQSQDSLVVANYKLYATQNMWTFIKLDTRSGVVRQVQYSVKDSDSRFETFLNPYPLVSKDKQTPGRFELYPTQNIYNFILLDRISGETYQVQWSTDPENRGVVPIE